MVLEVPAFASNLKAPNAESEKNISFESKALNDPSDIDEDDDGILDSEEDPNTDGDNDPATNPPGF